jgi:hypothetical protein
MRRHSVTIRWDHLGRYPKSATVEVNASSLSGAASRAVREIKGSLKTTGGGWREIEGSTFSIRVLVGPRIGPKKKERLEE